LLRKSTVRDEVGKRGMFKLRGHRCSVGSQAQNRNESREIAEVNAPLGKQLKGQSHREPVHTTSCFLGCTSNTMHGERGD